MNELIRKAMSYDLTGEDILSIVNGKAVVRLYRDLEGMKDVFQALGKYNCMVLLFPTSSNTHGHWICVLGHPKERVIEFFDSYGFGPRQEMSFTNNRFVKEDLLGRLLARARGDGYHVVENSTRLQEMKEGIDTCGRWVGLRIRLRHFDLADFVRLFQGSGRAGRKVTPDYQCAMMTYLFVD